MYLVEGHAYSVDDPENDGFVAALAAAHAARHRPFCLCVPEGVEMYVARFGNRFVLKRMPYTGDRHASDCASYGPSPELSGLGQVLDSAICDDPDTGNTSLRLGFALSKSARQGKPAASVGGDSVASDGTKLTLRGLLHYLWDQAELTHWRPEFAGKRSWATVRKKLLEAAEGKISRGHALQERLYLPEVFSVERRDEINARRVAQWVHAAARPTGERELMLLVGVVKEIVPARYGFRAVIKHVPDQAFALDAQLYRRMERRFEQALSLWGSSDDVQMMVIATFATSKGGVPSIEELSLMPVTEQWLPIDDSFDRRLLERLLRERRHFMRPLRYNMGMDAGLADAVLLDTDCGPTALYLTRPGGVAFSAVPSNRGDRSWHWDIVNEPARPLPASRTASEIGSAVNIAH